MNAAIEKALKYAEYISKIISWVISCLRSFPKNLEENAD